MLKSLLTRHSLARRLVTGFLFISVLPLAGLAVLNLRNVEDALTNTVVSNIAAIADKKVDQIDNYINERRLDTMSLSRLPELIRLVKVLQVSYAAGLNTPLYQQTSANTEAFLNKIISNRDYHDVLLIDNTGNVLFSLRKEADFATNLRTGIYRDTTLGQGFRQALNFLSVDISAFEYYEPSANKPAAFIVAPLLQDDLPIGAVAVQINLEILEAVITDNTGLGETGEAVFAQQTQDKILFTTALRHFSNAAFHYYALSDAALPMRHALNGERGQGKSVDYANYKVVAAWRYLPNLHWGMVVKMDVKEALAPLFILQYYTAWSLVLLLILVGIAAFILFNSIIRPVRELIDITDDIANGKLDSRLPLRHRDEFGQLAVAFNHMAGEIQQGQVNLEQRVASRTRELLAAKNRAVDAFTLLQQTQDNLIQAEKMAALGGLVAGIAHEINTPVGITLTSATYLAAETEKIAKLYAQGELAGDELEDYFDVARQSSALMTINSQRAADLIHSFKQVAVDQSSGERRQFELKSYIDEILLSLRPNLKRTTLRVQIDCPAQLTLNGYPGALSQLLTNFIMNSLFHAYEPQQEGTLSIRVTQLADDKIELIYADDGKGIPLHLQSKIFDPFFTTQRGNGGSGLGLHIVYNIVTQTLRGSLQLVSDVGKGTIFTVRFPRIL